MQGGSIFSFYLIINLVIWHHCLYPKLPSTCLCFPGVRNHTPICSIVVEHIRE